MNAFVLSRAGIFFPMSDPFRSARSVLRRASHHIANLKQEIEVFTDTKPYTYRCEDNGNGFETHLYIFSPDFSDDISCIMFDAVNNLRAALDQMAYAIAFKYRGPSKNYAYFPFTKDFAFWDDRINGAKNDFPPEIIAFFERCQPYKGGNNTLWAVDYIANVKKHALLIPVGFGRAVVWQSNPGSDAILHGVWVSDKYEIKYTSPRDQHETQRNFTYSIVISDTEEVIDRQAPIALLDAICIEVARVIAEMEVICERIGLFS
jgi:hypothetical protein